MEKLQEYYVELFLALYDYNKADCLENFGNLLNRLKKY